MSAIVVERTQFFLAFGFLIQFDRGLERLEVRLLTRDLDRLLPFATEIANGKAHAVANEQWNLMKFSSRFDGLTAAICFLRMPHIPPFGAGRQIQLLQHQMVRIICHIIYLSALCYEHSSLRKRLRDIDFLEKS